MIRFQHKTALITGAGGGIGRAVAHQMAEAGASLALCDLSADALDAVRAEVLQAVPGAPVSCHVLDVSDSTACNTVVAEVAEARGAIDYLVNSAGIYPEQWVRDMTDQQWRKLMSINLDGTFFMCRAVLSHLAPDSAIVNLSSMAGHRGSLSHAHYAASKGGVSSLSKSLARELAPGTRVNIVAPGIIATPMTEQLLHEKGQRLKEDTPMQRFGTAEEVASVICFLCSDLASFMTGETLHVNGGLYVV